MSGSQSQGQRSGEGTAGLWNHVRDDDERKEKAGEQSGDDVRRQYAREGEQQQATGPG